MQTILEIQNPSTVGDVLGSFFIFFFIYNYTFLIRNFNSLYLMQLMYLISFSVRSKSQLASKFHVSHLYLGPSTIINCQADKNCAYAAQLIVMGIALVGQLIVGCYALSKKTNLHETEGSKYIFRRIYFGFYSVAKATSIPVFFTFLDSLFDLANILAAVFSGLMLLAVLLLNLIIFKAFTFLNLRSQNKVKVWLDLSEYITFYLSVLFAFLGFKYNTNHLNLIIIILMLAYCIASWMIKNKGLKREQEYISENQMKQSHFATMTRHKKRQNKLQLLFFILQLVPFSVLIGYFDLRDDIVFSSSVDGIVLIVFSSLQFILIIILLIMRCPLESFLLYSSHMDHDALPKRSAIKNNTEKKENTYRQKAPEDIIVEFNEQQIFSGQNMNNETKNPLENNQRSLTDRTATASPKKQSPNKRN